MPLEYSIAAAKDQLPRLVRQVEQEASVTLTRRGRPVAVLVSAATYRRLMELEPRAITAEEFSESDVIGMWRDRDDLDDTPAFARDLRRSAERRERPAP